MDHPNIIKMKEFVETSEYCILVMELMRGGDLFDRIVRKVNIKFCFQIKQTIVKKKKKIILENIY